MRRILMIFLFGIALQRTLASLEDSSCSEKLKLTTEFLDTRLKSFGETLNLRLESFENRITQSECSKKSTIQNGGPPSSDHWTLVKSIFNKFINISLAWMSEGDLEKYLQYLIDLYDLQIENGNVTKANIPFDWEKHVKHPITQYNIMVKNGDLTEKSVIVFDPKDMNVNNIIKTFKTRKEEIKLNQETIKNETSSNENYDKSVKKASTDYLCTDRTSTNTKFDESKRDLKSTYDAMQVAIKDYRSWQNSLKRN